MNTSLRSHGKTTRQGSDLLSPIKGLDSNQSVPESFQRCGRFEESLAHALLFMQIRRREYGAREEMAMAVSAATEVLQRQSESPLIDVTMGQAVMTRVFTDQEEWSCAIVLQVVVMELIAANTQLGIFIASFNTPS